MKIINDEKTDFHVHSSTFSDGFPNIDQITEFSGRMGMRKVVITDHSQACWDREGKIHNTHRSIIKRWKNVYNDVDISFGVEGDLLNENGDVSFDIQGIIGDFIILSFHEDVYHGDFSKVTEGFIKAIERFHKEIDCIGHLSLNTRYDVDVKKIVEAANRYDIPIELNCSYLFRERDDREKTHYIMKNAKFVIVNSDAHTLAELRDMRKFGFRWLKENGYIK